MQAIEMQSIGPWPKNMFADVNRARVQLKEKFNYVDLTFVLIGPKSILNISDALIPRTACSYATSLKKNGLVDRIVRLEDADVNYLLLEGIHVSYKNFPDIEVAHGVVKIHGVAWQAHVEAPTVTDERLLELVEIHIGEQAFTIFENHPDAIMLESLRRLLKTRIESG